MATRENDKKILDMFQDKKTIGEILEELGWGPKSSGRVTQVLRIKYDIPYGMKMERVHRYSIQDVRNTHGLETLLFNKEKTNSDPPIAIAHEELTRRLLRAQFRHLSTEDAEGFGTLHHYRNPDATIKVFYKDTEKTRNVLVVIDGFEEKVKDIAATLEFFYSDDNFKKS